MGICKIEGCNNPIWGGGVCRYHNYTRYMRGGDKHERKKPAKRSPKRAQDERRYKDLAKEFFDEAVKNGTNICVFCGKKVTFFEGLHHLKGRTGEYLLDKEWWRTVHNKCHVWDYHQANVEQRLAQPWWEAFLMRLKEASEELYNKELKKYEKAPHKLHPKLWDEEEDF